MIAESDLETVDFEQLLESLVETPVIPSFNNELKTHCPFHDERTPSFYLNSDSGLWQCFGCGKSGDAISLLQELKGTTFHEAVEELGISIESNSHNPPRKPADNPLLKATVAQDYLRKRGFSLESAVYNGASYVPKSFDSQLAGRLTFELQVLSRDKLRHVGYTGRAISNEKPKWMHSKGIDKKKSFFIRPEALADRTVVLVEGVFDALALIDESIYNVAAYLGSHVSADQALTLRYAFANAIVWPDYDDAGEAGTLLSIANLKKAGLNVGVIPPAVGETGDPCSIIQSGRGARTKLSETVRVWGRSGDFFSFLRR